MYGSAIKVRYGAYIEKFAIAENLSPREAENKVRDILNVPRIGAGWINETQLYNLVKVLFVDYEVLREVRTDWLGSQRIDIFIPALSVAIEYQGEQHFRPVALFGGEAGFLEAQARDKRKRQLCKENGVKLVYFKHTEELSVKRIEEKLKSFLLLQGPNLQTEIVTARTKSDAVVRLGKKRDLHATKRMMQLQYCLPIQIAPPSFVYTKFRASVC